MILDSFRLDGKVALVTGPHAGSARRRRRARRGGRRRRAARPRRCVETAERIRALGRRVHPIELRLRSTATAGELDAAVAEAIDALGRPRHPRQQRRHDPPRRPRRDYPAQDWDDVLTVNLDAVFHLSQAAGRHMLAQGRGRIINVASMLSFQGGILVPAYTASKHAVAGLTKALANEWAAPGVTVNAIAPGYMATDNTAALRADVERERVDHGPHPRRALGRAGRPAGRLRLPRLRRRGLHHRRRSSPSTAAGSSAEPRTLTDPSHRSIPMEQRYATNPAQIPGMTTEESAGDLPRPGRSSCRARSASPTRTTTASCSAAPCPPATELALPRLPRDPQRLLPRAPRGRHHQRRRHGHGDRRRRGLHARQGRVPVPRPRHPRCRLRRRRAVGPRRPVLPLLARPRTPPTRPRSSRPARAPCASSATS